MLTRHIGIVAETSRITMSELTKVAAAIQKQVTRDFGPIWDVSATVNAFAKLEDIPNDYCTVTVKDNIHKPGQAGLHDDHEGQPFALVQTADDWSRVASHEIMEMLCDPSGKRIIAGQSPKSGQGRVSFLVEVCDPCGSGRFAYTINGITVSDFCTPHYFDPVTAPGVRYSFTGALKAPRTVLKGGYLSWGVPETREWYQLLWLKSDQPKIISLGNITNNPLGSLRTIVDRLTPKPPAPRPNAKESALQRRFARAARTVDFAAAGRARHLRELIKTIVAS